MSDMTSRSGTWQAARGAALLLTVALVLAGCEQPPVGPAPVVYVAGQPAGDQQLFDSDEQAAQALVKAASSKDRDAVRAVLGPVTKDLSSGDSVQDANGFERLAQHASAKMRVEKKSTELSIVHMGQEDWPFPIPLVKTAAGKWFFDTASGKEEILARRIGANELNTIKLCRAYVLAQREYASKDRNGNEVLEYAQRLSSRAGTKDGLYWAAGAGEEQSPFGPLAAEAAVQGYTNPRGGGRRPFHGYYLKVVTRQGPDVPGGRYDYVINGNMIAGFALVACPAQHGSSGIMTFVVNHQGKVYQKDLGPGATVRDITEYNPDKTWTLVTD
ncbi:MAG: hypothetical protein BWX88_00358 [Planctomycetes bacterium ADurb.Bin126]|nr:MAG: hypothetical protein BWX88_00358 [Planctomycetes bacterium ADurb.Bin126]HOD81253.1 DUF2950 domain-containing protein [Phycisphaerae bacterium]HQL71581.1 DUF2950 domain-containing protein [Phycisphaerae bacterium]